MLLFLSNVSGNISSKLNVWGKLAFAALALSSQFTLTCSPRGFTLASTFRVLAAIITRLSRWALVEVYLIDFSNLIPSCQPRSIPTSQLAYAGLLFDELDLCANIRCIKHFVSFISNRIR